jgi:hypothetical protein
MNKDTVLGIVRHVLTFGAGFLVSAGYTDDATAQQIAGGLLGLIGVIWSVVSKQQPSA